MEELNILRAELLNLKDCITKYLGFIFAGLGASIYGLARLNEITSVYASYFSLTISNIVTFIAIIFFYKFHSHNRLAGYCKALSHEIFRAPHNRYHTYNQLFCWEYAVGKLRELDLLKRQELKKEQKEENNKGTQDTNHNKFDTQLDEIFFIIRLAGYNQIANEDITSFRYRIENLYNYDTNRNKIKDSLAIIFHSLVGKLQICSWAFPPYLSAICILICLLLICYSLPGMLMILNSFSYINIYFLIYFLCSVFFHYTVWKYLLNKLYRLMKGDLTIHSFMQKFILIRTFFLIRHGYIVQYLEFDDDICNFSLTNGCT